MKGTFDIVVHQSVQGQFSWEEKDSLPQGKSGIQVPSVFWRCLSPVILYYYLHPSRKREQRKHTHLLKTWVQKWHTYYFCLYWINESHNHIQLQGRLRNVIYHVFRKKDVDFWWTASCLCHRVDPAFLSLSIRSVRTEITLVFSMHFHCLAWCLTTIKCTVFVR